MKLVMWRTHMEIVPEDLLDLAFIEDTLGLRKAGDSLPLVRQRAITTTDPSDPWAHAVIGRLGTAVALSVGDLPGKHPQHGTRRPVKKP